MAPMTHEWTTPEDIADDSEPLADPDDRPTGHDDGYDWDPQ